MNQSAAEIPHLSTKEKIETDIKNYYKQILKKHLEDRIIKEEKIKSWMNNILIDSKEYFINKYPQLYQSRPLKTMRAGGRIFKRVLNNDEIKLLPYDTISFENWQLDKF